METLSLIWILVARGEAGLKTQVSDDVPTNEGALSGAGSMLQPAEVAQTAGLNCLFFVQAVASSVLVQRSAL